jgi:hypothetical protein
MAINTNKNILITPGAFSALNTAVSQIDLKWYESGVGTFVFTRSANDLRSTIYNWVDLNEPVLQFGGMGTVGNQQYFVGPYSDYVGGFNGISSLPSVKIYPISGQLITNTLKVNGKLYDYNNSYGLAQQILSSSSSGIAWTNPSSVGILTGSGTTNYVARFISPTSIGTSYITDDGSTININLPINNIVALTDATINTITVGLGSAFYPTNLALGYKALFNNTSSLNAIAIGYQALLNSTNSSNSIALGVNAGQFSNSSNSIAVGNFSLRGSSSTYFTGSNTVAIGHQAGQNIGSASNSVIIGSGAQIAPDGSYQIAIGYEVAPTASNLGSWGGNTNITKTDLGIGTYTPLSRLHIETLAPGNKGLYIAGAASQTANLLQIDATTSGVNYVVVTGVGSVGVGTAFPTQILHIQGNTRITGGLYDSSNNIGLAGSVISSTGNGIAWTSTFLGTILANQVAFGASTKYITGSNNLWFTGTNLGIGTSNAPYTLTVQGDTYVSGFVTSLGFFGPGTNITNLNATNLSSGIVPSQVISGSYSGINSVGVLSQLFVSGFSTVYSLWLDAQVYDINNSPGSSGSLLTSIGSGVAWSTPSQVGIITGSASANQIAYWNASNQIMGSNNFVITGLGSIGIGTSSPTSALTVRGDSLINGLTVGLGSGQNSNNTVVGFQAFSVGAGIVNVSAMGYQAARFCNSASITAVGYQAMSGTATTALSLASGSAAFGFQAGQYANAGSVTAIGFQALQGTSGIFYNQLSSTAIGNQAGRYSNGNSNVVIGSQALSGSATTTLTGANNVVAGTFAARFLNSTGSVAIGHQAMQGVDGLTNGTQNVAVGYQALVAITTAGQNVAVGYQAANNTQTAGNNVVVGYQARLGSATTPFNSSSVVAVGSQTMKYHNGTNSVFVGASAGFASSIVMGTGNNNTVVGHQAMFTPTTAANNIVIGYLSGASMTAASNNIIIGYQADSNPTASYQIALGYQAFPTGNNLGAWGGNTNTTRTDLGVGTFTPLSRLHIQTLSSGNRGIYIAGAASQTANLLQVDATTSDTTLVVVGANGSMGLSTNLATQTLHIQGTQRLTGALFDFNNLPGAPSGVVSSVLHSTGAGVTWAPIKRSIITELMTGYTVSTAGIDPGIFIFPYDPNDGVSVMNFTFKRVIARCETTSATGITTINIAKSIGTGQFFGTSILTNNILISGIYEGFSTSFGISTAQSGDKIAVNFVGTAPTFANWTIAIIARET